ncbi:hypothetical protein HJG54_09290 [Leptolyngbya sp. NK1-12]|uniref:Aminoglycoside phosphotransferase domain-containing protein n=1 Tax=Leptolyngbya sp. NK1-12 TaxID=2547451 RepID=A0AA96WDC4_9CYAN|nr:hypothetical protein [Leptolyngbya sp. NK1-12]WNZ23034.1 hypothetical protein HJG54_09290 [Leptolyngbya sp. NK1-12]
MDTSLLAQLTAGLVESGNRQLVQSILGTTNPRKIAQLIQNFCQAHCHQQIAACEFWEVSVSLTVGLRLENAQRIVLKFRSCNNITLETLQAVCRIQQALAEQGFPAARLVLWPRPYANSLVSIEQMLDQGENRDAHDPLIREAMAEGLVQQIQLAQPFVYQAGLPRSRFHPTQLWEKPHNALFDFERTRRGAEWIDQIASRAQAILRAYEAPLQIGHMDWSVKNMRFQQSQISAVYDWDSLRLEHEPVIVGNAAKGFLVTWYVETGTMVPTPEEVNQFVRDYETARDQPFTDVERKVVTAALIYSMAYTARCEHALDSTGKKLDGSFRAALRNASAYGFG